MAIDARTEHFWLVDMDGYICLFSNMRLDRDTVPEGLFCYDVRDADCDGTFAEVQPFVLVNHWGTVISKEPIPLNEYGCYWPERDAFYFPADNVSLSEYQEQSISQLVAPYRGQRPERAKDQDSGEEGRSFTARLDSAAARSTDIRKGSQAQSRKEPEPER